MAKKTPNVLADLLFHTADPASGRTRAGGQPAAWQPPEWGEEAAVAVAADDSAGGPVPIHASRRPALQRYAARHGLSLRDAVDQALALLLGDDPVL
jgi:hypothetical protein